MNKKEKSEMAAELGRAGGKSLVKKYGKDYMSKIGKQGSKARWASLNESKKVGNKRVKTKKND